MSKKTKRLIIYASIAFVLCSGALGFCIAKLVEAGIEHAEQPK